MDITDSELLQAGTFITTYLGKWFRGSRDREYVRNILFRQYSIAACIIQRSYRLFKVKLLYKILFSRHRNSAIIRRNHSLKSSIIPTVSFQKIISGIGTIEDKLVIWRLAIDLRRAFPFQSIDTCLKAVLDAQGDFQRATVCAGTPNYASKHFTEFPVDLRELFLPLVLTNINSNRSFVETIRQKSTQVKNGPLTRGGILGIRDLKKKEREDLELQENNDPQHIYARMMTDSVKQLYFPITVKSKSTQNKINFATASPYNSDR